MAIEDSPTPIDAKSEGNSVRSSGGGLQVESAVEIQSDDGQHPKKGKSPWNSLEVIKLLIAICVPVSIAFAGYWVARSAKEQDEIKARRELIDQLARAALERRGRAELVASAIRRHAREPIDASLAEIIRRKREYDQSYVDWNANVKRYMLALRQASGGNEYSKFEEYLQKSLINRIFNPLDSCVTTAFDFAVRNRNQDSIGQLDKCGYEICENGKTETCGVKPLLQFSLDCSYAITEQATLVAGKVSSVEDAITKIQEVCPMPNH